MRKILFIATVLATTVFMTSCSKSSNETDYASKWAGVYNDPTSVPNDGTSTTASLNNVIVSKVNASTLKIQVKALETNYIYTYVTLKNVSLNGATKASIDETDALTESTGTYHIKGTVELNGTQLTLNAIATNTAATKESDVRTLHFSGFYNQ